jgi:hypothetical protein
MTISPLDLRSLHAPPATPAGTQVNTTCYRSLCMCFMLLDTATAPNIRLVFILETPHVYREVENDYWNIIYIYYIMWLRHYATNRKVAGSKPDEVNFLMYLIFPAALGPGVYSASNRNEYQKH